MYGFYYNKTLFKKAGLTRPPKTLAELTAYAKKLTKKNADGSLEVVGFDPFIGFYQNTDRAPISRSSARSTSTRTGKSSLGKDPAWQQLLRWQKSLVDYYGHDKLVKWQAGAGDEFSASHAFETRQARDDDRRRVARRVHRGRAPGAPVRDGADAGRRGSRELYGAGYINGTIIGIPKSGKNRDEAWKLVKYLTTNDHALAQFSNGIRNVPSTRTLGDVEGAEAGRELRDVHEDLREPEVGRRSRSRRSGSAHLDTFANFLAKWQAGQGERPADGGLEEVDKQIDAKLKQAGRRRRP